MIAVSLAACDPSELPDNYRITLPTKPPAVQDCFKREFPDIPDRALTKRDIVRIIGEAKLLDRAKTACGEQATRWIERVVDKYAKRP